MKTLKLQKKNQLKLQLMIHEGDKGMEVVRNIAPASQWGIKCPYKITPTRVVVHNTANDASADNEVAYMISNPNEVSYHYAVDDTHVVQGIEENRNTWSCGDGLGSGNMEGINIEICYSLSGGERFDKAEDNAARFVAETLERYGWGIDRVTKHQDYNGKYCPHRTLDNGWERFLNMVSGYLNGATPTPQITYQWIWYEDHKKWAVKCNGEWIYDEWIFDPAYNCWYRIDKDGWMLNCGWYEEGIYWYYLNSDGAMQTGWIFVNGVWYYLDSEGRMQTGWTQVDGEWYYLLPSGAMYTGWIFSEGYWYFLAKDGKMLRNTTVDGYVLDKDGRWIT